MFGAVLLYYTLCLVLNSCTIDSVWCCPSVYGVSVPGGVTGINGWNTSSSSPCIKPEPLRNPSHPPPLPPPSSPLPLLPLPPPPPPPPLSSSLFLSFPFTSSSPYMCLTAFLSLQKSMGQSRCCYITVDPATPSLWNGASHSGVLLNRPCCYRSWRRSVYLYVWIFFIEP